MVDMNIEIDSFILKFRQLWGAGLDAHLDLETHAGNAWVNLKLNLGQNRSNPVGSEFQKRCSPSRARRRERRSASFKCNEDKIIAQKEDEVIEVVERKIADSVVTDLANMTEEVIAGNSDAKEGASVNKGGCKYENSVENLGATIHEDIVINDEIAEEVKSKDADIIINDKIAEEVISEDAESQLTNTSNVTACSDAIVRSPVVTIHATAVIENSPHETFSNDEWVSVLRFIADKEHMKKNVADVKYGQTKSRMLGNGISRHTVELEIFVKTEFLWETPRAYIWKHIGQDSWERRNGSSIRLTKIHQK